MPNVSYTSNNFKNAHEHYFPICRWIESKMIPVYKKGVRYVTGSLKLRAKQQETLVYVIGTLSVALCLLILYFIGMTWFTWLGEEEASMPFGMEEQNVERNSPREHSLAASSKDDSMNVQNQSPKHDAEDDSPRRSVDTQDSAAAPLTNDQSISILHVVFTIVAGYVFGFVGSIPVAGPTSAVVLKLGIQGDYWTGQIVAMGGATAEATYAGLAYWGFGNFLSGIDFLLPISKVLGAVVLLLVGTAFLCMDVTPRDMHRNGELATISEDKASPQITKSVLLGLTMSGINPALFATYTAAIATVYGTGLLRFNVFLALFFAAGVCAGISTWFYLLLSFLKKYKQRLRKRTIKKFMKGMGLLLLCMGILFTKSSMDYFFFGEPPGINT